MIIGKEFAAWLESRERQRATADAMEILRRRWSGYAAVSALREEISRAASEDSAAFLAAAERFFDRSDCLPPLLDELMTAARADPFFRPPFKLVSSPLHSGLLLFDSPNIVIGLGIVRLEPLAAKKAGASGGSSIMFNGQWTLLRPLRAGDALLSFWEAEPVGESLSAEEAGQCRLVERRRLRNGETILLDGRRQSFVVEHALSDIVLLQANIRAGASPFTVEYDSRTLDFVGATTADETNSRLELMVSLLRLLDAREAIPVVREALATASFHTRWQMMRELLAWDAEAALPALRQMAEGDPHAEVRAAARHTLEMFFAEEPEPCHA
jgi:hypothetical protein